MLIWGNSSSLVGDGSLTFMTNPPGRNRNAPHSPFIIISLFLVYVTHFVLDTNTFHISPSNPHKNKILLKINVLTEGIKGNFTFTLFIPFLLLHSIPLLHLCDYSFILITVVAIQWENENYPNHID